MHEATIYDHTSTRNNKNVIKLLAFFAGVVASFPVIADDIDIYTKICGSTNPSEITATKEILFPPPPPNTGGTCNSKAEPPNILLVMDTSEKMYDNTLLGASDGRTRFEAMQQAALHFLDNVENANVGIMRSHALGGSVLYPVTPIDAASSTVDNLDPNYQTDPTPGKYCTDHSDSNSCTDLTDTKTARQRMKELVNQMDYMYGGPMISLLLEAVEYMRGGDVYYGRTRGPHNSNRNWINKIPDLGGAHSNIKDRTKHTFVSHPSAFVDPTSTDASDVRSKIDGIDSAPNCHWYSRDSSCQNEIIQSGEKYHHPITKSCQESIIFYMGNGKPKWDDVRWPLKTESSLDPRAQPEKPKYEYKNNYGLSDAEINRIYLPDAVIFNQDNLTWGERPKLFQKQSLRAALRLDDSSYRDLETSGAAWGKKDDSFWNKYSTYDNNRQNFHWGSPEYPDVIDRLFKLMPETHDGCRERNHQGFLENTFAACTADIARWASDHNGSRNINDKIPPGGVPWDKGKMNFMSMGFHQHRGKISHSSLHNPNQEYDYDFFAADIVIDAGHSRRFYEPGWYYVDGNDDTRSHLNGSGVKPNGPTAAIDRLIDAIDDILVPEGKIALGAQQPATDPEPADDEPEPIVATVSISVPGEQAGTVLDKAGISSLIHSAAVPVVDPAYGHASSAYLSFVEPSLKRHWEGNIKSYDRTKVDYLGCDANNSSIFDSDGQVLDTAQSCWTPHNTDHSVDGSDVHKSGVLGRMLDASGKLLTRTIYLEKSDGTLVDIFSMFSDPNKELSTSEKELLSNLIRSIERANNRSEFSIPRDQETQLIRWILGFDTLNKGEDTLYGRNFISDSFHVMPQTISAFNSSTQTYEPTMFVSTNGGFVHAINSNSGDERFAILPREGVQAAGRIYLDLESGVTPTVPTSTPTGNTAAQLAKQQCGEWMFTNPEASSTSDAFGGQTPHVAGSFTSWDTDQLAMTLVDNDIWKLAVNLESDGEFKFKRETNWTDSYGDNNEDGVADSDGGGNIAIETGSHIITLDLSGSDVKYSFSAGCTSDAPAVQIIATSNTSDSCNADAATPINMTLTGDNTWEANVSFNGKDMSDNTCTVQGYKFMIGTDVFGQSDSDANIVEKNCTDCLIEVAENEDKRVIFNDKVGLFADYKAEYALGSTSAAAPSNIGHIYSLDGGITKAVKLNGVGEIDEAEIIITQRRGGNAILSFDVTDISAPKLNWRLKGAETGAMSAIGETWGEVFRDSIDVGGIEHDVYVVTGGYDPLHDEDNGTSISPSTQGNAVYVFSAEIEDSDGNPKLLWGMSDENYGNSAITVDSDMKYAFAGGSAVTNLSVTGSTADTIFAVDIAGQVWRFDYQPASNISDVAFTGGVIADFSGDNRKFYHYPAIGMVGGKLAITVGSGQISDLDKDTDKADFIATILESNTGVQHSTSATPVYYDATDYEKLTLDDLVNVSEQASFDYLGTAEKSGWYFYFADNEKMSAPALSVKGTLVFNTYTPSSAGCELGTGHTYAVSTASALSVMEPESTADEAAVLLEERKIETLGTFTLRAPQVKANDEGISVLSGTTPIEKLNLGPLNKPIIGSWESISIE